MAGTLREGQISVCPLLPTPQHRQSEQDRGFKVPGYCRAQRRAESTTPPGRRGKGGRGAQGPLAVLKVASERCGLLLPPTHSVSEDELPCAPRGCRVLALAGRLWDEVS